MTYKTDNADERESPAAPLARKLTAMGADVRFHDPHVQEWNAAEHGEPVRVLKCEPELPRALATADTVVLLQAHRSYLDGVLDGHAVLDTRGVLHGEAVERL